MNNCKNKNQELGTNFIIDRIIETLPLDSIKSEITPEFCKQYYLETQPGPLNNKKEIENLINESDSLRNHLPGYLIGLAVQHFINSAIDWQEVAHVVQKHIKDLHK